MAVLKSALIAAAATAMIAFTPAASARSGWPTVATTTLDRSGTDNIYFPGRQHFRAIKLCVSRAPLRLRGVRIYYRNGDRHDAAGRQWLNPGSCTLRMDLRGRNRDRDITRVRLTYDPFGRGGRNPVVRITAH